MGSFISGIGRPCAFIFNGSVNSLSKPQLSFIVKAVLSALSQADPQGRTHAQMRLGIPILEIFAQKLTAIHCNKGGVRRTISCDKDVYKYVIWDWLNSLNQNWSSVDHEQGLAIFLSRTGECIAFSALHDDTRDAVDFALKNFPGYVGGFEIDPGNPLHRRAFFDLLIFPAAIVNGSIVQQRSPEGDNEWEIEGAAQFMPGGLVWRDYGWLDSEGPRGLPPVSLSQRGAKAAASVSQKQLATVETRVIEAIGRALFINTERKTFEFQSVGTASDVLQAIMPEGKFTKYLFDRGHKDGGSKASFFIDELGFQPEDWRCLAAQFYNGLLISNFDSVTVREWDGGYGARFEANIRVQGRSGNKAVVVTGWNMKPGQLPSLSTAYPGDRNLQSVEPGDPAILPPGIRTDADWGKLWGWANTAGERAGEAVVPTPMYIVGVEPISEGVCGSAAVRVYDARTGLARWLVRKGRGKTDGYGGALVFCPLSTQSLDRAITWARAVTMVLRLNGIAADVETYLD